MKNDLGAYIALAAASASYAAVLNTEDGKKFTDEYTWATVVIGSSL